MTPDEVPDYLIYAFVGEPEITATDAHAISVGLARVLTIVEEENRVVGLLKGVATDAHVVSAGLTRVLEIVDRKGDGICDR